MLLEENLKNLKVGDIIYGISNQSHVNLDVLVGVVLQIEDTLIRIVWETEEVTLHTPLDGKYNIATTKKEIYQSFLKVYSESIDNIKNLIKMTKNLIQECEESNKELTCKSEN